MPMRRELYPPEWEEIALQVKASAHWTCEACDKPCLMPGEDWLHFMTRSGWTVAEALDRYEHPVRYVLTTAHLNHIPGDCRPENLKALCAPCHCRMDLQAMGTKQRLKREREGQLRVFDLTHPTPAGHGKDPNRIQFPISLEVEE